jgi:transcriptional regulator with GAF, ATPase, and Fis domain
VLVAASDAGAVRAHAEIDVTKAFEDDLLRNLPPSARLERSLRPEVLARFERAAYLLARADTRRAVADALVGAGLHAIGAATGVVVLLSADGERLELAAATGYDPDFLSPWEDFPVSAPTPLSDAVRSRRPVLTSSAQEMRRRYPGVPLPDTRPHAFMALPLIADGEVLGAWGLRFDTEPVDSIDRDTVVAGEVLSHIAAARVEHATSIGELEARVDQLQHALDSRVVIEQAKGMVAERYGVDLSVAFNAIRRLSRNEGRKIHDVAGDIVSGHMDPLRPAPEG